MPTDSIGLDAGRRSSLASLALTAHAGTDRKEKEKGKENSDEDNCSAFGFLRGLHDRAPMIEFRFRDGNLEAYPYSCLGPIRFNPSVGLLLRFTSDVVTLVLVRGSNLDADLGTGSVNLIDRGIERHRVTWVREMDEREIRNVGDGGPTIDRIEVAEFETQAELCAWMKKLAPQFLRAGC
jgi:hypothetical protein